MLDARTLLRAKRQEIRIEHPLASYTSSGQLRCVLCETTIKHPSAWDGHLGSKAHRTNAARSRDKEEEERRKKLEEETNRLKRKTPPEDEDVSEDTTAKKSRFVGGDSSLDQEWIQFQQSVINASKTTTVYDRATVVAEPELVSDLSKGLPGHDDDPTQPAVRADEEERRRKEQEERELIMDRLMDEERAQEEADMRVTVMKSRLDAIRKKRKVSRSVKSNMDVA